MNDMRHFPPPRYELYTIVELAGKLIQAAALRVFDEYEDDEHAEIAFLLAANLFHLRVAMLESVHDEEQLRGISYLNNGKGALVIELRTAREERLERLLVELHVLLDIGDNREVKALLERSRPHLNNDEIAIVGASLIGVKWEPCA